MQVAVAHAAEAIGVTPRTVNNWIRNGTLRCDENRMVDIDEAKARAEWKGAHRKRLMADPEMCNANS